MTSLRVWIHQGHDGDPGFEAWSLDHVGFATYGETDDEVLDRVPSKFEEYALWLELHGLDAPTGIGGIEVVERVSGNEVLFEQDRAPAATVEIERTVALLEASRADLIRTIDPLPDEVLDWDPPYRRFADWARWRSIRDNLWHIADAETHYYLTNIGVRPTMRRAAESDGDWRAYLPRGRSHAVAALHGLKVSRDRARVAEGEEAWSVRKALRRMVRHELMHTKSIRRVVRAWEASES